MAKAHVNPKQYEEMYAESIENPAKFWGELAKNKLSWYHPFTSVIQGSFKQGNIAWFPNGKLNVCYNCVDRHVETKGNQTAFIWEGDEPGLEHKITYNQLLQNVCRVANVLKAHGVRRGQPVCIYMPMIVEVVYTMLACARIGAPHSVVFAGFSADALRDRVLDCKAAVIVTADESRRQGRSFPLKKIVDEAVAQAPCVKTVLVAKRTGTEVPMKAGRDSYLQEEMAQQRPYCPCEVMDAEDTLFLLYTSGSTGKPKGVVHTQAGYLLYAMTTFQYTFDYQPGDIFACVADVGWITGHSYIVYGPACAGATSILFESHPCYPDAGRYWAMVEKYKVTSFYTAPTAIRALMKYGREFVDKYDLSSLRVLGTVGEPINPAAWVWYNEVVGKKRCAIVDTYWQTETGGHVLTPLPGARRTKPGSATGPFFGVQPVILNQQTGALVEWTKGNRISGILAFAKPWPGMARTVYNNHERYMSTYLQVYPGYYYTGDGCEVDEDGFYFVTGRVDDVINVAGHRLGTAEVESALVLHHACIEAAVIAVPHDIKGQCIYCWVILAEGVAESADVVKALRTQVRQKIGAFCTPDAIIPTTALPKTRSGKIMRRVLRKVSTQEDLGDTSTMADSSVVDVLLAQAKKWLKQK
eukprot:TRINITY_DN13173_c0_g1_i1.p1 TRINITY_DN13173_c0_g1~~TRINITY_DN13173_c0_g1_i1.p1  ORF type:complete len:689 (+),score=118.52 TRINITY_DN13173_c0_g1_i1:150-2069(+)